jgi:ribosomal protein S6--L-glutamate ligase
MRLAILSRGPQLYSTRRLLEAATARGHTAFVFDTLRFDLRISKGKPELFYEGTPLEGVDAVIPRIGASITQFGLAVLRQFEMLGIPSLNSSAAIASSRDKLRCLQVLSGHKIGLPPTVYTRRADRVKDCIELAGGVPVVVKLLEGTQGVGVVLAQTKAVAESVIEAFHGLDQNILVQQFIKEAKGTDVRAFVVGRRVIAAMRRQALKGEFRSNLHRGGSAEQVKLTPPYRKAALAAARALGLRVAGVDLLESDAGPMVMEVNSSPGLEGIEKATGIDVAGAIIDYLQKGAQADPAIVAAPPVQG